MTISAITKRFVQLFILSMAAACMASCARVPGTDPTPTLPPAAATPTGHAWQYLTCYGCEEDGYATYSYVLVGRDESNQKATSLYYELVKGIQGSTVEAGKIPQDASIGNFNLFLIPTTAIAEDATHKPNYALSKLLLSALSTSSPLKFSRPGPYIITLYTPISFGQQDDVTDILYMDLTNIHPIAIPEIVRTYKNAVLDGNLRGIEKLNSLRLSILNIALVTEDSIGFARTAYAKLRNAFSE